MPLPPSQQIGFFWYAVVLVTTYYKIISTQCRKTWANSSMLKKLCFTYEKMPCVLILKKDHKTTFHVKLQWRKSLFIFEKELFLEIRKCQNKIIMYLKSFSKSGNLAWCRCEVSFVQIFYLKNIQKSPQPNDKTNF